MENNNNNIDPQIRQDSLNEESKREREIENEIDRPSILRTVSLLDRDISNMPITELKKTLSGIKREVTRSKNIIKSLNNPGPEHPSIIRLANYEAKKKEIETRIKEIEQEESGLQSGLKFGSMKGGDGNENPRERYYAAQGLQQGLKDTNLNYNLRQQQQQLLYPYAPMLPYQYAQQPVYPLIKPPVNPLLGAQKTTNATQLQGINPFLYSQQPINPLQQYSYAKQMSYLNRALERESKLAFYANVELTLYPGKSVSALQKTSALCSANFNEIRRSLADIFGLQYYQAPIDDAYIYQGNNPNKINKYFSENSLSKSDSLDYSEPSPIPTNKEKRGGSSSIRNLKLKKNKSRKMRK